MTTTAASRARTRVPARVPARARVLARVPAGTDGSDGPALTTWRVVRAEMIQLRSLRSVTATLLVAVLLTVGIGLLMAVGLAVQQGRPGPPNEDLAAVAADPTGGALTGVGAAFWAVAVLGVLTVAGEYTGGAIRTWFTVVPRRGLTLAAHSLALAALVLPVTLVATVLAFVGARMVLATVDVPLPISAPGVPRAIVGAALYLTLSSVLAAALGWLTRTTAGGLAALLALTAVPQLLLLLVPAPIAGAVAPYLPGTAGGAIMQPAAGPIDPWIGLGVYAGYAAIALVAAGVAVHRRDP